jgi:hypothetical protein
LPDSNSISDKVTAGAAGAGAETAIFEEVPGKSKEVSITFDRRVL